MNLEDFILITFWWLFAVLALLADMVGAIPTPLATQAIALSAVNMLGVIALGGVLS